MYITKDKYGYYLWNIKPEYSEKGNIFDSIEDEVYVVDLGDLLYFPIELHDGQCVHLIMEIVR
jgi:hypothetical protein